MNNRYQAGESQGAFQPGSHDRVLRNKLGVTTPEDMAELELMLLQKLYEAVLADVSPSEALTLAHLKTWHRRWLGNVYEWAGQERSVNMNKGGFHFAVAAQIPRLLTLFERDCLARFTPCHRLEREDLIEAIAVPHVEFILIHPFREGNGRLSRLLADVMAVQAGQGPLDYSAWDAGKIGYFTAIQAGVAGDYTPMRHYVELALWTWTSGLQRASVTCLNLLLPARSLRSIRAMLCPVSMAVELATARMIACLSSGLDRRADVAGMVVLADFMGLILPQRCRQSALTRRVGSRRFRLQGKRE